MDLQADPEFQSLGIQLVSIAVDPVNLLAKSSSEMGITTPFLSDEKREMSKAYGVLRWAMAGNEPGHTFVLVKADGTVGWIRDYGAPENGGLMYVTVGDLNKELIPRLGASPMKTGSRPAARSRPLGAQTARDEARANSRIELFVRHEQA